MMQDLQLTAARSWELQVLQEAARKSAEGRMRASRRRYYESHRDEIAKRNRQYREKHREAIRVYNREYNRKKKEREAENV